MSELPPLRTVSLGDDEQRVVFGIEDLCRHTMIFGSPGSGAHMCAYDPLLGEMLSRLQAGALIVATTADAVIEAAELIRLAGREPTIVQPGDDLGLELLCGRPEVDAASICETIGGGSRTAGIFDVAETRLKNALRMLAAARIPSYTLELLTAYCLDDGFAARIRGEVTERLRTLAPGDDETWTLRDALNYEEARFPALGADARAEVLVTIAQLLEPFRDVHIVKTFASDNALAPIESVFANAAIVLHVPRTQYERSARAIYTLAKRRLFTALERRRADASIDRPIVFACDDYAACISSSDVRALGVAGSAGCMVLAATQGVSSLSSSVERPFADAVLQNFTQKIFFKTDDAETLATLARATEHNANTIATSEFFSMKRNQARCHVTVGDDSVDAIITLQPFFTTSLLGAS